MTGGLLSACSNGTELYLHSFQRPDLQISDTPQDVDALMEKQCGQDVIDSLSVLEAVVPTLHPDLWSKITELFPFMAMALRSRYAIIRQCAARCFSTICDVITADAMLFVIENLVPLIGDAVVLSNRQGTVEAVYRARA